MKKLVYIFLFLIILICQVKSSDFPKIEILKTSEKTGTGYYYIGGTTTKLSIMDLYGNFIKTDELKNYEHLMSFQKQITGDFVMYSPQSSKWVVLDKNLKFKDSLGCDNGLLADFHDMTMKSDGTYLLLALDRRNMDLTEYNEHKYDSTQVIGFEIQGFTLTKQNIFRWNTFDHFNVLDATSNIPIDAAVVYYTHVNSIVVDNDGNYLISSRHMDEITKINSTTGEIMWRMGGSECKNNQFTFVNDTDENGFTGFSHQHNPVRLPNGNLLLFDNGNLKVPAYSRVVEYQLDEVNKVATKVWEFTKGSYADSRGSVQRLSNGNTVIHWLDIVTEVNYEGEIVQEFKILNDLATYRLYKYDDFIDYAELNVVSASNYDFKTPNLNTDLSMNFSYISNSGKVIAERHNYGLNHIPIDSSNVDNSTYPVRYVIKARAIDSLKANVSILLSSIPNYLPSDSIYVLIRRGEALGKFYPITSYANQNTGKLEFHLTGSAEIVLAKYQTIEIPTLQLPKNKQTGLPISLDLKWNPGTTATSYRLVLENIDANTLILDTLINVSQISFENLSNFTNYRWKVQSRSFGGMSDFSDYFTFQTKLATPHLAIPLHEELKFDFINEKFKWDSVPSVEYYDLEICENPNFENTVLRYSMLKKYSLAVPNLTYSKNYYWRVKANHANGNSDWSETWHFMTIDKSPLLYQPSNASVTDTEYLDLVWKQKDLGDMYTAQLSLNEDFSNIVEDIRYIDTNYVSFSKLEHNSQYFWRVRIDYSEDKSSEWSFVWTFYTYLSVPVLTFPNYGDVLDNNSVILTWDKVDGASEYTLEWTEDQNFINNIAQIQGISQNNYNLAALKNSTRYYWRIKALNKNSYSIYSDINTFSTPSDIKIESPQLTLPDNGITSHSNYLLFEWTNKNNLNKTYNYRLQISQNNDFSNLVIDTLLENENYVNQIAFESNTQYYWRVQANYGKYYSLWSEEWSFKTEEVVQISKPVLVYPIDDQIISEASVMMKWELPDFDGLYLLEVARDIDFSIDKVSEELNQNDYLLSDLKPNSTYFWRIGIVENSELYWSAIEEFHTDNFGEGVELDQKGMWDFDPSTNTCYFKQDNSSVYIISITDLQGRNLDFDFINGLNKVTIKSHSSSVFFILFEYQKKRYVSKFLK